jgi:uncharacterized UBP type Zn finger protein
MRGKGTVAKKCAHTDQAKILETGKRECEDCIKTGDTWVHLRMCLTCGHVGCCDSSKNKHATRHHHETGHPLVRSIEPGENWVWCYVDQVPAASVVEGRLLSA